MPFPWKISKQMINRTWIICIVAFVVLGVVTLIIFYQPALVHFFLPASADVGPEFDPDNPEVSPKRPTQLSEVTGFLIFDVTDATVLCLVILIGPPAFLYWSDYRWRREVDDNLPALLREVSDAQKTGMPLPRAVMEASKRQYGPLTPELRRMAAKMTWGIGFGRCFRDLTESIGTPIMARTSILILEAERSGGAIEDVFDAAHSHVAELLTLRRSRLNEMAQYKWIIYLSVIVFNVITIILLATFFDSLAQLVYTTSDIGSAGPAAAATVSLPLNLASLQLVFFHLTVIESSLAGLVAGKMSEGNIYTGLRHSVIMLVISFVLFKLLISTGIVSMIL